MYIGSGDVHALMSGKETKSHSSLMQRFVSGVKPNYNAYASPIDALRTGAILENRYLLTLPDNYFTQYVVKSEEMDVFKCSLDFAKIETSLTTTKCRNSFTVQGWKVAILFFSLSHPMMMIIIGIG